MNIESEIKWIQKELTTVNDPDLIAAIKSLLAYRQRPELKLDIEFNDAYARAEKDLEEGRVTPHAEVSKKYEKWL